MAPEEIARHPDEKGLGKSSPTLKLTDFDLMRTLGTGMFNNIATFGGH